MNRKVTLLAASIQVTANDQSTALRYLQEDAGQMRRDWNYHDEYVEPTDEYPTEDADEVRIEVDVDSPPGRGERTWTGNARFVVVVEADDERTAFVAARAMVTA